MAAVYRIFHSIELDGDLVDFSGPDDANMRDLSPLGNAVDMGMTGQGFTIMRLFHLAEILIPFGRLTVPAFSEDIHRG